MDNCVVGILPAKYSMRSCFLCLAVAACIFLSGCSLESAANHLEQSSLRRTKFPSVFILSGRPESSFEEMFPEARRCLIMIPGISSGDLNEQCGFLEQIRRRSGADTAVFLHWGRNDPTRKIASPLATDTAAKDLAALCERIGKQDPTAVTVDILAHSAGTIITNKAAICLNESHSPIRFRHVLFLGTPHDSQADFSSLKRFSWVILNIHSGYDKINRNVSGDTGRIHALAAKPFWNLRMDTSLGGRRIRHYAFLENTPENWTQYAFFLSTGMWPVPLELADDVRLVPNELYRAATWIRDNELTSIQKAKAAAMAQECLANAEPEIRYYGIVLMGVLENSEFRLPLKRALETESIPAYLRREIYQALGMIGDANDLRFLQRMRKSDPESGDVLRDVLRDWKRKRMSPVGVDA